MTYGFGFWRTRDRGEPIPVAMWEAYREGIDDGRFITTLDRWIERAKKAGLKEAAAEAEADRQFVWDSIHVQIKYKYDDLWAPEAFDVYRWVLATQILKLRAALGQ